MFVVFGGVQMMAMRNLGVMRRLFIIARFVMFCRLAMGVSRPAHGGVPTSRGARGSRVPAFFSRNRLIVPTLEGSQASMNYLRREAGFYVECPARRQRSPGNSIRR